MAIPSDPEARFERFIEELRDELSGAPSTEAARQHVIRAVQATGWSGGIRSDSAGRIRWRKRLAFGSVFSGALAKFVGVGVALAATTAGVGATGVLPDQIQDPIAHVAEVVGLDLPDSGEPEPGNNSSVMPGVDDPGSHEGDGGEDNDSVLDEDSQDEDAGVDGEPTDDDGGDGDGSDDRLQDDDDGDDDADNDDSDDEDDEDEQDDEDDEDDEADNNDSDHSDDEDDKADEDAGDTGEQDASPGSTTKGGNGK